MNVGYLRRDQQRRKTFIISFGVCYDEIIGEAKSLFIFQRVSPPDLAAIDHFNYIKS
jgi:hypothetical protein